MKFEKIELTPSLKAEDYADNEVVIKTGIIKEVRAVKTKFDDDRTTSTIIMVEDQAEVDKKNALKGVFANSTTINNCIDAFGEESSLWENKSVRVICNKNNFYKKKMLVIEPIR